MTEKRPAARPQREPQGVWSDTVNEPPDGQCFVLIKPDTGDFKTKSPFSIKRELDGLVGTLISVKVVRSGGLMVQCGDKTQTVSLLGLHEFLGRPVNVTIAGRLSTTPGVIHAPELAEHSEAELLALLEPQHVVHVQRCREKEGRGPNPMIRVSFRGLALPEHIVAGYSRIPVRPWIDSPSRCQHCSQYGHRQQTCRKPSPVCGRCAGPHPTAGCEAAPSCAVCGDEHPVWSRDCRAWHHFKQEREDDYWGRHFRVPQITAAAGQWPTPVEVRRPSQARVGPAPRPKSAARHDAGNLGNARPAAHDATERTVGATALTQPAPSDGVAPAPMQPESAQRSENTSCRDDVHDEPALPTACAQDSVARASALTQPPSASSVNAAAPESRQLEPAAELKCNDPRVTDRSESAHPTDSSVDSNAGGTVPTQSDSTECVTLIPMRPVFADTQCGSVGSTLNTISAPSADPSDPIQTLHAEVNLGTWAPGSSPVSDTVTTDDAPGTSNAPEPQKGEMTGCVAPHGSLALAASLMKTRSRSRHCRDVSAPPLSRQS